MSRRQIFLEAYERFLREWPTRFEGEKPPGRYMPDLPDPWQHPALLELLLGVRFFDALPLSYLVPDAGLLPPESVRFFYVDPVYSDRLVEGVLSAARTGTPDEVVLGWAERLNLALSAISGAVYTGPPKEAQLIHDYVVAWVRDALDTEVALAMSPDPKPPAKPLDLYAIPPRLHLTGLMIRSELVRRWPKMRVLAYSKASGGEAQRVAVSRPHRFGSSVLLALISGVPARVEIHEPDEGCRFGVELASGGTFSVDVPVDPGVTEEVKALPVPLRKGDEARRVLDVGALAASLSTLPGAPKPTPQPSAWVSLGLEQRPYAQVFLPDPKKAEERELAADDWFERRVALIEALLGGEP